MGFIRGPEWQLIKRVQPYRILAWDVSPPFQTRWGASSPTLPRKSPRRYMGKCETFRAKGFYIYIDISLYSVKKRLHRTESFTTNKTHGLKKKIQKRVVKISFLDILSEAHQSRPSLVIIFLAWIPHKRFLKRRYPQPHGLCPSQ